MLPAAYEATFEKMLVAVAEAAADPELPLVPFWPIRAERYDGSLLVIGRSVNGWVEDWTARQRRQP